MLLGKFIHVAYKYFTYTYMAPVKENSAGLLLLGVLYLICIVFVFL